MAGRLDDSYIKLFKDRFEQNCISLLLGGYQALRSSGRNLSALEENDISVQLVGQMKANPLASDLQISINRESYIDTDATYAGRAKADQSPRIDIKFSTWNHRDEEEYRMEAKNLASTNWKKVGVRTPINARKLQKRYIHSGIDSFVNAKYVKGCLLGYVLQGEIVDIVEKINRLLADDYREDEFLNSCCGHYRFDGQYLSYHSSKDLQLNHFFLRFDKS